MNARLPFVLGLAAAFGLLPSPPPAWATAQTIAEPLLIESVFVRDMTLRDFAELMTRACASEWKVLVSEQAGERRISFYLANTGVEETLRSLCATYGLWYRRSPNSDIVQIITMEEYRQGVNLYADEAVEVVPILYPSPEEIGDALARLFQDRVVWGPPPEYLADDIRRIERALDRMDTIADRATLVNPDNLQGAISGLQGRSRLGLDRGGSRFGSGRGIHGGRLGGRYGSQFGGQYGSQFGGGTGLYAEEQTLEEVIEQQRQALAAQQAALDVPAELGGSNDRPGLVYISASTSANALVLRSSDTASIETIKTVIRMTSPNA